MVQRVGGRSIGIMIETLVKGIIIGIIISAPLGPVGALCLRETIYSGRREGLLTGLGAMLSDVLYGCLVFLGVELVWDLVLRYDAPLRIVGGIIILVFALILWFRTKEDVELRPTRRLSKIHGLRKVLTAFLITLSNPFIMLLILPLYTRLHLVQEGMQWQMSVAMLGLGLGCMLWWYVFTLGVSYVSRRYGNKSIRYMSRTVAVVLALLGAVSIFSGVYGVVTGEMPSMPIGGAVQRLAFISNY